MRNIPASGHTKGLHSKRLLVTAIIALVTVAVSADGRGDDNIDLVGVQFEVSESRYRSLDYFVSLVDSLVEDLADSGEVDLLVFPEYINVPILAAEYLPEIQASASLDSALKRVLAHVDADSLGELLRRQSGRIHPEILRAWRGIAERHGVAILPGTFFVTRDNGELRNRTYVIDDRGRVVYQQDKVYLTPFERDVLQISPGSLREARPFRIEGGLFGVTICRDSYFSSWDERFERVDAWIDLRANGELYSSAVRERFRGTLPERVRSVEARGGINASLSGSFLDLVWEGPAYTVDHRGIRTGESPKPTGTSSVELSVPLRFAPDAR